MATQTKFGTSGWPAFPFENTLPEKDDVLAGLLCCEMVARRGIPLANNGPTYLPMLVHFIH